jgi:glutamyl-tRNA reductase
VTTSVAVAGVSCHGTPAEVREHLHLTAEDAAARSRDLAGAGGEAVVLATCNRTEVYVTAPAVREAAQFARDGLSQVPGKRVRLPAVYIHANEDAARHLFRVAAGLESIVLGDMHVAAQVRRAYDTARQCAATGPTLDRLFEAASRASKRVRARTSVSSGPTTIAGTALLIAADSGGLAGGRRVLVVGAGRIGRVVALGARSRGCEVVITSRSLAHARGLARDVGGRAAPFDVLDAELGSADTIFACTASRGFVLSTLQAEVCARRRQPLVMFDLALPRDIDPAFRHLGGVHLFDLDDIASVAQSSESGRRGDLELADRIIQAEAEDWEHWRRARAAAPAITAIRQEAEQARRLILDRHRGDLARLAPEQRGLVDIITAQLTARLLHPQTVELRRQALLIDD